MYANIFGCGAPLRKFATTDYHYPFSLPRSSRSHSRPWVGALYIKGERGTAQLRTSPGGKACEFFMRLTWFPAAPSPPVSGAHFPSHRLRFSMRFLLLCWVFCLFVVAMPRSQAFQRWEPSSRRLAAFPWVILPLWRTSKRPIHTPRTRGHAT